MSLSEVKRRLDELCESTVKNFKNTEDRMISKFDNLCSTFTTDLSTKLDSSLSLLFQELTETKKTVELLSNKYNELQQVISTQTTSIDALRKENTHLKITNQDLSTKLTAIEELSRRNNIEFHCVPETKGENVIDIVKEIHKVVSNEPLPEEYIVACRRVAKYDQKSTRPRNILLTLPTPKHRDSFLSSIHRYNKAHKTEKLNSTTINIPGEKTLIFAAENLTPEKRALHFETRKVAKLKDYNYVWVRFGKIFARKNDRSPVIVIKNYSCLDKII